MQPGWVPPNLKFEIDDCTQKWTWDENSFDLIHMRYLFGAIADWTALFQEAFRACKPGGWAESSECEPVAISDDGTVTAEKSTLGSVWGKLFVDGGKKMGRSFAVLSENLQRKWMEEAGFVDIQKYNYKVRPDFVYPCQYLCNMIPAQSFPVYHNLLMYVDSCWWLGA